MVGIILLGAVLGAATLLIGKGGGKPAPKPVRVKVEDRRDRRPR